MAETFGKNPEKNLSIGILAHVDAGKTTLSEALLYLSGKIRKQGKGMEGETDWCRDGKGSCR